MDNYEIELRENLEESYLNYEIDDSIKNKGKYLRNLRVLNDYLVSVGKPEENTKLVSKNKTFDRTIDISDVDDTPYLVDDILEGGIID